MDVPKMGPPIPETNRTETNTTIGAKVKPRKPLKGEKGLQRENVVKGIFEVMRRHLGYPEKTDKDPIPNYGQEGQAIKRMLTRGYQPADILGAWRAKVDARKAFVSMVYVNQDIGGPERAPSKTPRAKAAQDKHYGLPNDDELAAQAAQLGIN
jgi:hypothetical protein